MSDLVISTENLSRTYQRGAETISALRDVSIEVRRGEFVAITGSSGSGKSTLLYILGLLDTPTGGRYFLSGSPVEGISEAERARIRNERFGFVFQSFHLLPKATALRNASMPLTYCGSHGKPLTQVEMDRRAAESLQRVGLADRLTHRPNELSGGQRQRVAIARAIVNNPDVLFADEPTGNLDSKVGAQILDIFSELHRSGTTILMVTHDPKVAARGDRQLIMADGQVVSGRT